jgi:4-hydroxy-tetrahydrodipicolinate synthase
MFKGVYTAIVTPFKNGELDEKSLRGLIEFQLENQVDGMVPCGTTGESPTLSVDEYKRVIQITVETVKGRVPVVAGAGSNSTKAMELSAWQRSWARTGCCRRRLITTSLTRKGFTGILNSLPAWDCR